MWIPGPVPQIVPPHCHYNPSRPCWFLGGNLRLSSLLTPDITVPRATHLGAPPHIPSDKRDQPAAGLPSHSRRILLGFRPLFLFAVVGKNKSGTFSCCSPYGRILLFFRYNFAVRSRKKLERRFRYSICVRRNFCLGTFWYSSVGETKQPRVQALVHILRLWRFYLFILAIRRRRRFYFVWDLLKKLYGNTHYYEIIANKLKQLVSSPRHPNAF